MKKLLLGFAIASLMSMTAVAAPIIQAATLTGTGIYEYYPSSSTSPTDLVTVGSTAVEFASNTATAGNCFGVGSFGCTSGDTITLSSTVFSNADAGPFTLTWASGLVYSVDTGWTVGFGNGFYNIKTTGVYSYDGMSTNGILNFSWQQPFGGDPAQTSWSASGSTVPEPGTMALLGAGLVGLGVMARRRRKS